MLGLLCAATLGATACGREPVTPERADAIAERLWSTRCIACHGEAGDARGPGSGALAVVPPDMTTAAFQERVTDEHLRRVIIGGGKAVGLSVVMPANVDLREEPEVVSALVRKVRGFGEAAEAAPAAASASDSTGAEEPATREEDAAPAAGSDAASRPPR